MARGVRVLVERRGGTILIIYPDGRAVRIPKGLSVLDASRRAGFPHASVCGGRARCSTCRVRVLLGSESLAPPSPAEARVLTPLGADRAVRLACQLKPMADISVWPLLPPEIRSGMPWRSTPPDLAFGSGALSLNPDPSNFSGTGAARAKAGDSP
jgi:adenylate cyclase